MIFEWGVGSEEKHLRESYSCLKFYCLSDVRKHNISYQRFGLKEELVQKGGNGIKEPVVQENMEPWWNRSTVMRPEQMDPRAAW